MTGIIRPVFISLLFIITASISASAQAVTPQTAAPKIGFVNTEAFYDDKIGVKRLVDAYKALEVKATPRKNELEALATKIVNLEKELAALQDQANKGVNIDRAAAATKSDEYERLKREYKFKADDFKVWLEKERQALTAPISVDIGKALDDFAKQKGFNVLLDISKLSEAVMVFGETADSTKEFTAFFNARPAGVTKP